ncbi:alpha-1,2-fucosyltransferase [Mucilaginibacter antarcticus]|uniref:Alpha-1,2-fucosyltransferase n=1 Tax=Mucilaginibacter antarcticus TaxID=1855725 RepID=A0ABW5XL08_9SPHI
MVAVKLEGRLGNQLFQYAFIFATAKRLNTHFYLDRNIENFIPAKYFEIDNDVLWPIKAWIGNILGKKANKVLYTRLEKLMFGDNLLSATNYQKAETFLPTLTNNTIYGGYFQSTGYFANASAELREQLTIKKRYRDQYNVVAKAVSSPLKTIAIHIRRGDYVDLNWALPLTYYKKALAAAEFENALCIFISDDPDYIKAEFAYINNKYISDHTEIIDLQFLINADVCILSSSSFSWWGAWLNINEDKKVFAPKHWLGYATGKEYPTGIADGLNFNYIENESLFKEDIL